MFVRKNAIQVLIPKYGLEATLYLNTDRHKKEPVFEFNEEVSTHKPLYNTVCYNTALDITQFKDGSQKCIDYTEK